MEINYQENMKHLTFQQKCRKKKGGRAIRNKGVEAFRPDIWDAAEYAVAELINSKIPERFKNPNPELDMPGVHGVAPQRHQGVCALTTAQHLRMKLGKPINTVYPHRADAEKHTAIIKKHNDDYQFRDIDVLQCDVFSHYASYLAYAKTAKTYSVKWQDIALKTGKIALEVELFSFDNLQSRNGCILSSHAKYTVFTIGDEAWFFKTDTLKDIIRQADKSELTYTKESTARLNFEEGRVYCRTSLLCMEMDKLKAHCLVIEQLPKWYSDFREENNKLFQEGNK